jgi:16S rRNA (uracil1498-N3)-methyltransferase
VTTPRFLVSSESLAGTSAVLSGAELRHLRARRLRAGGAVILSDGLGQQRRGIILTLDRHRAVIRLADLEPAQRESPLRLVVAQAALKADKLDFVVEKTTELGVSELLVLTSERTVVQVSVERMARLNRIARSAAKQCQRSVVPPINGPIALDGLLVQRPDCLRLFLWEGAPLGGLTVAHRAHPTVASVLAVIGPEGGFSTHEARRATEMGWQLVGLSARILRAETAAVSVTALCQFLWGDLGGNAF